ncbi:MAG: carboxypeptidase-like regulatory domain-containing protein, partial [Candidatus Acidiferrum sp.]
MTLSLRSRKTSTILNGSAILLLFLVLSVPADAQVVGATLTGVVTDPSGAPIANVSVTVKNMATGVTRTVPTDSSGIYSA